MSEVQYVGARYVPIFADPIDWDKNKAYEPLTNVRHLETMYTSKIRVPTGIEITNETYWVPTANYNAQFETYRQDIVKYKSDTDSKIQTLTQDLNNYSDEVGEIAPIVRRNAHRRFIFNGDSYGVGYGLNRPTEKNWPEVVKERIGIADSDFYNCCVNGTGFGTPTNFLTNIKNIENTVTSPETITDIVVGGGYNDIDYAQYVSTSIDLYAQYCKGKYPNAKIWVFFMGFNCTENRAKLFYDVKPNYINNRYVNGFDLSYLLHRWSLMQNDYFHPNANGEYVLGENVASILTGGVASKFCARSSEGSNAITFDENGVDIIIDDLNVYEGAITIPDYGYSASYIFSTDPTLYDAIMPIVFTMPCTLSWNNDSTSGVSPGRIVFQRDTLTKSVKIVPNSYKIGTFGAGVLAITDVRAITVHFTGRADLTIL